MDLAGVGNGINQHDPPGHTGRVPEHAPRRERTRDPADDAQGGKAKGESGKQVWQQRHQRENEDGLEPLGEPCGVIQRLSTAIVCAQAAFGGEHGLGKKGRACDVKAENQDRSRERMGRVAECKGKHKGTVGNEVANDVEKSAKVGLAFLACHRAVKPIQNPARDKQGQGCGHGIDRNGKRSRKAEAKAGQGHGCCADACGCNGCCNPIRDRVQPGLEEAIEHVRPCGARKAEAVQVHAKSCMNDVMPDTDFTSIRLFVAGPLEAGGERPLEPQQVTYLRGVMRLPEGAELLVFDGVSGEFSATLQHRGKRDASVRIGRQTRAQPSSPDLWLLFAPLKHARLDYLVQKAVEMGAGRLQPVITRYTQVSRVNTDRMKANVIEAAEQCGVLAIPEVHGDVKLDHALDSWDPTRRLFFCDERAAVQNPVTVLGALSPGPMAVLIGPEGGFSPDESERLRGLPFVTPLALGPRILRADTAAVAALAVVQASLGDWS